MNKDYQSGIFTWSQPYQMSWAPPKPQEEIEPEVVDLTLAQELIAKIKNGLRN